MMERTVASPAASWAAALALVIAVATAPFATPRAWADGRSPESEARALTVAAKASFDAGRFAEAAALLGRAHALAPSPVLLYNMGRAYQQAGDRPRAIDAYQRYLAAESAPPDEGAIRRTIQQLQDEMAREEALAARADAEAREKRQARAAQAEAERRARHAPRPLPWIIAGTGAGALVAGGILGALARNAHADAVADADAAAALSKQSSATSLAIAANVAFVAGGALALSGLVWGLFDLRAAARSERLTVTLAPGSLVVGGRF